LLVASLLVNRIKKLQTMKLSDFFLLNAPEMQLILLHEGVLIAKRDHPEHMVFLFQLDTYYVEMYCSKASKAAEEFRVSVNMQTLTPYLAAIQIDDLLR
jgi:hypothetical protein